MSKSIKKNFGFTQKPIVVKALTKEEKKFRFVNGILNATNLSVKSRLNLLGSLEGTVNDAQLLRMFASNKASENASNAGSRKGKGKLGALIKLYEKNPSLHSIKTSSKVAREIMKLVDEDRRVAENRFGKERTIAQKIRDYRESKK